MVLFVLRTETRPEVILMRTEVEGIVKPTWLGLLARRLRVRFFVGRVSMPLKLLALASGDMSRLGVRDIVNVERECEES